MQTVAEDDRLAQVLLMPVTILTCLLVALVYSTKNKKIKLIINEEELRTKLHAYQPEPFGVNDEPYTEPTLPENIKQNMNLCRSDYLCLTENEEIPKFAIAAIHKYGVGSCGPRGFYGTIDIHLDLEKRISDFMNIEETILYSYSLSTMSSVIVAYCKKGDMLFCDEKLGLSTVASIAAARSSITYFKHNDVKDLEEKLIQFDEKQMSKKIKARKFLIIEGIYSRTGQMCHLPQLMKLREKYMLRMFLDECVSFGSIGSHGRGVTEYFNVDRTDIDLIIGSLELGIPSIGGFCVGSNYVIEHQRLSGLGYCFSASLPPLHSAIAKHAIDIFETTPELFTQLNKVASDIHDKLLQLPQLHVLSHPLSPKKVFTLESYDAKTFIAEAIKLGIIFGEEEDDVLYLNINVKMDKDYINNLFQAFKQLMK